MEPNIKPRQEIIKKKGIIMVLNPVQEHISMEEIPKNLKEQLSNTQINSNNELNRQDYQKESINENNNKQKENNFP